MDRTDNIAVATLLVVLLSVCFVAQQYYDTYRKALDEGYIETDDGWVKPTHPVLQQDIIQLDANQRKMAQDVNKALKSLQQQINNKRDK